MKSETRPRIILVTGTPGTGKTTISKLLAERLSGKYLGISNLAESENLILEKDNLRDTLIVDIKTLKKRIHIIASSSQLTVIDSHFATDIVSNSEVELTIVLRRAPWLLYKELSARGYNSDKIKENVEAEIIGVCLSSALESISRDKILEVDTSNKTPEEVVSLILSVIINHAAKSFGKVDWMSYPEIEALLKRF